MSSNPPTIAAKVSASRDFIACRVPTSFGHLHVVN
jgi:hypothetical protein